MKLVDLYHGTNAKQFESHEIRYPFWVTLSYDKAERFSLRGRGEGDRRIMVFRWNKDPYGDFFQYDNDRMLYDATGRWFKDEDGARYAAIAKALKSSGYAGLHQDQHSCVFRSGWLSYERTIYLDRDEDYDD